MIGTPRDGDAWDAVEARKHSSITLVLGRPLIPDLKAYATGTRGEVRFTVDESDLRPQGPQLVKPVALSVESKVTKANDGRSSA